MKTMAIRLDEELHAALVVLAQVDEISITEEIRRAVEAHVAAKRSEPGFAERAQTILAEIDQEAATRRDAIQALFTDKGATKPEGAGSQSRAKGRKGEGS